MSHDTSWDIDMHRDEHESDEHWSLRRAFIEKWKNKYAMDRLLCLARVFTNIEFMDCRYPAEVMQEVASLSLEVANSYRSSKKDMLKRTFVSASDAAEDRARGIKRKGGIVEENTPKKINFVSQGHKFEETVDLTIDNSKSDVITIDDSEEINNKTHETEVKTELNENIFEYVEEFEKLKLANIRCFRENMFNSSFGRMVLMVRNWLSRMVNIQASCSSCGLQLNSTYEGGSMTFRINGQVVASASGPSKAEAKAIAQTILWNRMRTECVILLIKEQFIAKDAQKISTTSNINNSCVSKTESDLSTPLESSVAAKMMKLMGWTGGGLGANEEGISEPIKPHLQQVHRAGLGSNSELASMQQLKRRAGDLMRKYYQDDMIDYDLVFSADFSKEERTELHQVARRSKLISKSYGVGNDRFLVVRKKTDPFSLTRAVIQNGGVTPKYQVFLPQNLLQMG